MKYLYLDTETGGLNADTDALLTIGLVAHDDQKGILETAHILVNSSNMGVNPKALEINHIELGAHNAASCSRQEAALKMKAFITRNFGFGFTNKPFVVGHNITFDRKFIDPLFNNDPPFSYRNLDTMGIGLFMYDLGILPSVKSLKLDFFIERYGIQIEEKDRHTALGDALATRLVHLAMRKEIDDFYKNKYSMEVTLA